jgi:hypothetical protein
MEYNYLPYSGKIGRKTGIFLSFSHINTPTFEYRNLGKNCSGIGTV